MIWTSALRACGGKRSQSLELQARIQMQAACCSQIKLPWVSVWPEPVLSALERSQSLRLSRGPGSPLVSVWEVGMKIETLLSEAWAKDKVEYVVPTTDGQEGDYAAPKPWHTKDPSNRPASQKLPGKGRDVFMTSCFQPPTIRSQA